MNNINTGDGLVEDQFGGNVEELLEDRSKATSEMWNMLSMKECMRRLNSRQLWHKEGDKNSSFCHNSIKERNRINDILSHDSESGLIERVDSIKEAIIKHFEKFFKEENFWRPLPEGLSFNSLDA